MFRILAWTRFPPVVPLQLLIELCESDDEWGKAGDQCTVVSTNLDAIGLIDVMMCPLVCDLMRWAFALAWCGLMYDDDI